MVLADFSCEVVADFIAPGYRATSIQRWAVPPRVTSAFAQQTASMRREILWQIAALHIAIPIRVEVQQPKAPSRTGSGEGSAQSNRHHESGNAMRP